MVDYKEIKLVKDGEDCVPFAPHKADKSEVDDLLLTKASKMELEDAVEKLESKINEKQDKLIAGENINITENVISTPSKVEVPLGAIIKSSTDLNDDNFAKCNGRKFIKSYDENCYGEHPKLYRLYNQTTTNFHQQLFTTDKDICKKKNPDITKLYRPIRSDFDTYGMNIKGFVQVDETISMSYGEITSESSFYDGKYVVYVNKIQILQETDASVPSNTYAMTVLDDGNIYYSYGTYSHGKKYAFGNNVLVHANSQVLQYKVGTDDFVNIELDTNPSCIIYANETFVGIHNGEDNIKTVVYSNDGITWLSNNFSTANYINDIAYGNNKFVIVGENGVRLYSTDGINWSEVEDEYNNNLVSIIYGNNRFIAISDNSTVLSSVDGITWSQYTINFSLNKIIYAEDYFVAITNSNYIGYSENGINWNWLYVSYVPQTIAYGFNLFAVSCNAGGFYLAKHDVLTPLKENTKAQLLNNYQEHSYIDLLSKDSYTLDYKTTANDTNGILYSAADTDMSISDNGWLVQATDGKYLYFGTYDEETAKWTATSLIYSANISSAGSENNAIDMEFDFITPPAFVASKDIFYSYRTLIFRVADVDGNLNMYMSGYNSSGLKWRYSNKSTGITLSTNTKYHLHFETTDFSETSPYYTYTLTITPYNMFGDELLTNETQTHVFTLAYLPYNYYSNSATNSMMSIYHGDASTWTSGQMLDLRSFKLSWSGTGEKVDTYALNKTTRTATFEKGLYMPYLENSYVRIK